VAVLCSFISGFLNPTGVGKRSASVKTPATPSEKTGIDADTGQFLLRDFNGDGRLDVALFGKDHITGVSVVGVMLGNGDGTFQSPRESPSGSVQPLIAPNIMTVTAGDYNGDGKIDIAFLFGDSVSVLLGKGDGTFSPPMTTSWGGTTQPWCIATGDFNGDTRPDLAIATAGADLAVYVLLGNGDGSFESPMLVSGGSSCPVVVADLNGDGKLDLISGGGSGVTVLLGDGTGHFPTSNTYPGPSRPTAAGADAKTLVKLIQSAAGEKPQMWGPSIIGFGSYHYRYHSGREGDMPLIGFSPRKAATVLYNLTGSSDSKALLAKLGKHTTGKGLRLHQEAC
jgi:VCBS repeat protein